MTDHIAAFRQIEERIAAWSRTREDLRAVMVVGSRARKDVSADEYADLDVILFADRPDDLLNDASWLAGIGTVKLSFVEQSAFGGLRERRALFEPMLDVEFSTVPSTLLDIDFATTGPVAEIVRPVVDRGYRILHDPEGKLARLDHVSVSPASVWTLPAQPSFDNLVIDFWYRAMWVTKNQRRGELDVARQCLDGLMKDQILQLINWLAHLGKPDTDAVQGRRFFDQWTDQDIVESFHATNGTATRSRIVADLERSMELFSSVARSAADRMGYPYPDAAERHVREWIRTTTPATGG